MEIATRSLRMTVNETVFSFFQNASDLYLGELFFDTSLFVHCAFLVALTYQGFCSAFMSAVWVVFPLLTKLCVYKDFKKHGREFFFVCFFVFL
jgi:hypothetical protein